MKVRSMNDPVKTEYIAQLKDKHKKLTEEYDKKIDKLNNEWSHKLSELEHDIWNEYEVAKANLKEQYKHKIDEAHSKLVKVYDDKIAKVETEKNRILAKVANELENA